MNRSNGRVPWAWFVAGLIVLTVPTLAGAHAQLVRSTPAARGVLTAAPDRVRLWFNENLEPVFTRVSVWSADGPQVDRGMPQWPRMTPNISAWD